VKTYENKIWRRKKLKSDEEEEEGKKKKNERRKKKKKRQEEEEEEEEVVMVVFLYDIQNSTIQLVQCLAHKSLYAVLTRTMDKSVGSQQFE
jgi:hypothetical protein